MTGYQKLKKENEMLWKFIESLVDEAKKYGYLEISEEALKKELALMKWNFDHETSKEKN